MNEATERRDLVRYSLAMYQAGWVANHDGNLSVRVGDDRIVCTPTAFSKADVTLDDLVVVNAEGKKIAGRRRPFSEMLLHRAVFSARSDVGAVVHAHPPMATAYGAAGQALPHPFLPEAVVSLGAEIPLVPLTAPGADAVAALRPWVRRCDAVIIAGNGVLAWGPTLELAYLRLELVEHLARIAHTALPLGGVKLLPSDLLDPLVAKRAKAGLSAPEEGQPVGGSAGNDRVMERVRAAIPNADPARIAALAEQIARQLGR
jgi:L-fuculose-phosphate aldolase